MSESAASLEQAADPTPPTKPATIYDVAQAAGVSHQTVSRFLKGFEGIRPETREKVVRALDELGYRPNLTARSLKSGRSHRIGALTHEISKVGPSRVAEGATAAASEAGYVLDLISLDVRNPRAIEESLELITQHDLAGVLALASTDEMTARSRRPSSACRPTSTPRRTMPSAVDPRSRADERSGLPALIAHLADSATDASRTSPAPPRGRRPAIASWRSRRRSRPRGSSRSGVLHGDWSARSGYDAIAGLARLPDATAFVAANDQMALGAMLALKERGLRDARGRQRRRHRRHPRGRVLRSAAHDAADRLRGRGSRCRCYELLARIEGTGIRPGRRAAAAAGRPSLVGPGAGGLSDARRPDTARGPAFVRADATSSSSREREACPRPAARRSTPAPRPAAPARRRWRSARAGARDGSRTRPRGPARADAGAR